MSIAFVESREDVRRAAVGERVVREAVAEYAGDGVVRTVGGVPFDPVAGGTGVTTIVKGNRTASLVSLDDVEARPLHYLWHPWLREGVNILAGPSGARKSTLAAYIASRATCGRLDDENGRPCRPQRVLYVDQGEDDLSSVLKPRFLQMGADTNLLRFYRATMLGPLGTEVQLTTSAADLSALRTLVGEWRPGLIIVDPITLFVDGDLNSAKDVQPALLACRELAQLAGQGCCVLGLHHFNRSGTMSGSQKFIDTSRSFMEIMPDPDDDMASVMSLTKSNNAGLRSLRVTARLVESDTGTIQVIDSVVPSKLGVRDLQANRLAGDDTDDINDIDRWLLGYLDRSGGRAMYADVIEAGCRKHFSKDQLKRAKKRLRIVSDRNGVYQGPVYWRLPGAAEE